MILMKYACSRALLFGRTVVLLCDEGFIKYVLDPQVFRIARGDPAYGASDRGFD